MSGKLLVVDDDNATLSGLVTLLREAGYDVIGVTTLPQARRALAEEDPDLLITDIRLGAYNGLQLLASNPSPIPAIIITGFPDSVLEIEARRLGAEFVLKPVAPAELLQLIAYKFSEAVRDGAFRHARRWPRKHLQTELPAQVDDTMVRVVDMSYGGLRLALDRAASTWLPRSFQITFPTAALSVRARVVWREARDANWLCGAVVTEEKQSTWRQLVDAAS